MAAFLVGITKEMIMFELCLVDFPMEICLFFYSVFVKINPNMVTDLENAGLSFVGKDETNRRMEVRLLLGGFFFI